MQKALTASRATGPFDDVTLSEAAPESSLIELSDDDIEVDFCEDRTIMSC